MHSRVFEISEEPFVGSEDYKEFSFEEPEFSVTVADYIVDSESRSKDIEWFVNNLPSSNIEFDKQKKSIRFTDGFKLDYFSEKYENLKNEFSNMTLESFSGMDNDSPFDLFLIQKALNDHYGFWVYKGEEYYTLDDFVRMMKLDTTYYIGGVGDFHF